jgi:hypothetical protein
MAVPPESNARTTAAAGALAAPRDRVVASNGVLFVCQRDVDCGKVNASSLVPGCRPHGIASCPTPPPWQGRSHRDWRNTCAPPLGTGALGSIRCAFIPRSR